MKRSHYELHLSHDYVLNVSKTGDTSDEIIEGKLMQRNRDQKEFPIINKIPRFVDASNYTDNFGLQWNTFRSTQLDSHSGMGTL